MLSRQLLCNLLLNSLIVWNSLPAFITTSKVILFEKNSCRWGTTGKYQNGMPKVARKALIIGEVWNPVYCHGNKTVKLILWDTSGRISLQRIKHFWCKLAKISVFIISDQNLVELIWWHNHLANLQVLKTWLSLERNEIYFEKK